MTYRFDPLKSSIPFPPASKDDWIVLDCNWIPTERDWHKRGEDWRDDPARRELQVEVRLLAPMAHGGCYYGAQAVAWLNEHVSRGNSPRVPDDMLNSARAQYGEAAELPLPPYPEWWPAYARDGGIAIGMGPGPLFPLLEGDDEEDAR